MKTLNDTLDFSDQIRRWLRSARVVLLMVTALAPELGAAADQSFFAPRSWAQELTRQQGWGLEHPRMLADVNGDERQDVVGFGDDGVWLATSTGTSFSPAFVLADFGYHSGWRVQKHVRTTGDINDDNLEDVVGFGDAGVYRALSTATGFATATFVVANFGYDQGWRVDKHVRLLADVSGDGRKDIVAFGDDGVWLSLATSSGFFSEPAFVVADFGFNQGWTPSKHIRTTADVNGDGLQDIVGFGDHGVWTALSTGRGFGPAQFVLADFGYEAGGWRVDRHPRLLADIDGDGTQDIVAFGDDGVWTARSTGSGFEAAQFVLADFGYHSGWRVGRHPRFVADLNGDGYQDIVGYGEEAVYRALGGGPGGFDSIRGVLRSLVAADFPYNVNNSTQWFPRFVGNVDNNGTQDLVAFDHSDIMVAYSSDFPPLPPPAAPSNPRITGKTSTSLTVAWNDNSSDERRFFVIYGKAGSGTKTVTVGANVTTRVLGSLDPDTQYCFTVQAESLWGVSAESPRACGRTDRKKEPPEPTSGTTSVSLRREQIISGPVPYAGSWGPITGARPVRLWLANTFGDEYIYFVRSGHSTTECFGPNHSNATVTLKDGGSLGPAQIAQIQGATPPAGQKLFFVACYGGNPVPPLRDFIFFNLDWTK